MAAYPAFPQLLGSTEGWVDDLRADRAVSGSVRTRAFYAGKKRAFSVRHVLGNADLATFRAFYEANRKLAVTLTWVRDGQTYTCLFAGAPTINYIDRNYAEVVSQLLEQ